MRTAIAILTLLTAVAAAGPAPAGDPEGTLQVTCRPGFRVYLDGEFAGLTTVDEDGLHLRTLPAGTHSVRVEKLGFHPREETVEVIAGRAVEVRVDGLVPLDAPAPPAPPVATAPPTPAAGAPAPEPAKAPPPPAPDPQTVALEPAPPAAEPRPLPVALAPAATPSATPLPAVVPSPRTTAETQPAAAPPATPLALPPAPPATPAPTAPVLLEPTKPVDDILFVYRLHGALAGGRTVTVWRERGGPRAPVLAFTCGEEGGCSHQTSATFPPGPYRFRVSFTRSEGTGRQAELAFRHEVYLDLEARPEAAYVLEADYGDDDPTRCTATVREAEVRR